MKYLALSLTLITLTFQPSFAKEEKIKGTIPVTKENKLAYSDLAKISLQQAIGIASEKFPGKITEIALEREDGFLVYEVEIVTGPKNKKEIIIDAGTGSVLQVEDKKK